DHLQVHPGPGVRLPARRHPSRHEAGEHPPLRARRGKGRRLWRFLPAPQGFRGDAAQRGRLPCVHVARADPHGKPHPADRHLFPGGGHVPAARGTTAFPGVEPCRAGLCHSDRRAVALWEVLRIASWKTIEAGTSIVTEGERADSFYLLVDGEARVTLEGNALNTLKPGDCFGDLLYFTGRAEPRTTTVAAIGQISAI